MDGYVMTALEEAGLRHIVSRGFAELTREARKRDLQNLPPKQRVKRGLD